MAREFFGHAPVAHRFVLLMLRGLGIGGGWGADLAMGPADWESTHGGDPGTAGGGVPRSWEVGGRGGPDSQDPLLRSKNPFP